MLELAKDLDFALEAETVPRVGEGTFQHDLDRYIAARGRVDGAVDDALAPPLDLPHDLVARERTRRQTDHAGRRRLASKQR